MKTSLKEKILGTWYLQSILIISDEKTTEMFGPNPNGIAMFDTQGNISTQIGSSDREPINQENVNQAPPDKIKHAFDSYMAFFGHYSEPEPGVLKVKIKACLLPYLEGTEIIRYVEITDDQLILTTPPAKQGFDKYIVKAVWLRS